MNCCKTFVSWLATGLKQVSNKNTRLLASLTSVLSHFGLSNQGKNLLAALQIGLAQRTFCRMETHLAPVLENETKQPFQSKTTVIWFDNWCRGTNVRDLPTARGQFQMMNLTAVALRHVPNLSARNLVLYPDLV